MCMSVYLCYCPRSFPDCEHGNSVWPGGYACFNKNHTVPQIAICCCKTRLASVVHVDWPNNHITALNIGVKHAITITEYIYGLKYLEVIVVSHYVLGHILHDLNNKTSLCICRSNVKTKEF